MEVMRRYFFFAENNFQQKTGSLPLVQRNRNQLKRFFGLWGSLGS